MQSARVIVCEKTGRWAGVLRRWLAAGGHRLCETRSWADCWRELALSPASVLAVELTPDNDVVLLKRLVDLAQHFPQARAVVMGESGLEAYDWAVREAGAAHVVFAPSQLAAAARLIERHLALAPQPPRTLREAIWQRLPWRGWESQRD